MDLITKKAELLKALAQPTRLRILDILKDGERCVCDMLPLLGEEQANVSKHLAILRQAGIVEYRKEGVSSYYRIKNPSVLNLLRQVDEIIKEQLQETLKLAQGLTKK